MGSDDAQLHDQVRTAYDAYHDALAAAGAGRFVRFMNYGYRATGTEGRREQRSRSDVVLPPRLPNPNAARLVLELIGDEPMEDRTVLDIGCGRGGALWLVTTYFGPRRVLGIDLTAGAARAAASIAPAVQGDAEALPVRDESVDVVLNIESSLHYPMVERFYAEVSRVLRTRGALLYTDLFLTDVYDAHLAALARSGFTIEADDDITANVLASRDERAERESRAFTAATRADSSDVQRFVGIEGTAFHQALADRTWTYRLLRLRRTRAPAPVRAIDDQLAFAARAAHAAFGGFDHEVTPP